MGLLTIINPAPAPETALPELEAADILTPNESEAQALLGLERGDAADEVTLASELRSRTGARHVIITLGERGLVACDSTGIWRVAAPKVTAVDTTGAGDAFNGALAAALVQGRDIKSAAAWACQAAAYSVTQPGTIPYYPTTSQVQDFIRQVGGLPSAP